MPEWLELDPGLAWWVVSLSVLTFFGTLLAIPVLLVRMPADYFLRTSPPPDSFRAEHPLVRWAIRIAKNGLGAVFVIAGVAMLVLPGQGILTILIGITLLDLPGKRRVELALIRREAVLKGINWMRRRANRPPLQLPQRRRLGFREPEQDNQNAEKS
ncbi:Putative transmembrane protein (PGPGW) [Maioricimonas rarisocia]|uniref:Transmembrane protein (PGPGW) n=1 Tax=Maioricimonas rarisocia TaxID=2528026 RepID=A0A517ZC12_9PLAN|nr:PGPGW domain-containing protein [Maioricimonas rarisocia]QDU39989.1 Putative transmembrane protein (PGPGW) [Maioricimonas rarisocia]